MGKHEWPNYQFIQHQLIVPGNPPANNGQLIYIWNGLEPYKVEANNPNNLVMQPVLQWGANGSGPNTFGGQYWTISNWCAWSGGGAYTTPVTNIPVVQICRVLSHLQANRPMAHITILRILTGIQMR